MAANSRWDIIQRLKC